LVLTDSKNSTKSGKYNEILGSYDARKKTDLLKTDRIQYWLGKGIAVTGTVHNLLVSHKILDAKKINVLPKKTAPAKVEVVEEPKAPVEEAPAPIVEEKTPEAPMEETTPAEVATPVEETATVVEAEPVTESNPVVEAPTETPVEAPVELAAETPSE